VAVTAAIVLPAGDLHIIGCQMSGRNDDKKAAKAAKGHA
jgi:hypothetical protein